MKNKTVLVLIAIGMIWFATASKEAFDQDIVKVSVSSCEAGDIEGVQNHFNMKYKLSELRQSISQECLLNIFDSNIPFVEKFNIQIMMDGVDNVIAYSKNGDRHRLIYEVLKIGIDVELDRDLDIDDFVAGVQSVFVSEHPINLELFENSLAYFLSNSDIDSEKYGISQEYIYKFKDVRDIDISDLRNYCDDDCVQKSLDICTIDNQISAKYAFLSIGKLAFRKFLDCGELTLEKITFLRVSGVLDRKCGDAGQLYNAHVGNNDLFDECFKYLSYLATENFSSEYDVYLFKSNLDRIRSQIDEDVYLKILGNL